MRIRHIALLLCLAVAVPSNAQVAVRKLKITNTDTQMVTYGWVAYIDLGSNRFTPVVTPSETKSCGSGDDHPYPMVRLKDTLTFAYEHQTLVAITANTGLAVSGASAMAGTCTNGIAGLLVSTEQLNLVSEVVSPPQYAGSNLYFAEQTVAAIDDLPGGLTGIRWAVAGSNITDNDCGKIGAQLVVRGDPGGCTVPKSKVIAPRDGAGVDQTGRYLILAIVQGDESRNLGLTTHDFAGLMIGLGAYNAVNFDGGGSTAFIWDPGCTPPIDDESIPKKLQTKPFPSPLQVHQEVKNVSERYMSNSACDFCYPYRPIYASFGLIDQRRVGAAKN